MGEREETEKKREGGMKDKEQKSKKKGTKQYKKKVWVRVSQGGLYRILPTLNLKLFQT